MDIKKINYKDFQITIWEHEPAENPNDWNDNCFLLHKHRSFTVTHTKFKIEDVIEDYETDKECIHENHWIVPIQAYIHSGVVLQVGCKEQGWDISFAGFVLANCNEYTTYEDAEAAAENLIKSWNEYLSGEVYEFTVENDEYDDCCGGYYGDRGIEEAIATAMTSADNFIKRSVKRHTNYLKRQIKNNVPLIYRQHCIY